MAPGEAVKVLLATCPRALLRSTLTAPPSAKKAAARKLLSKNCLATRSLYDHSNTTHQGK